MKVVAISGSIGTAVLLIAGCAPDSAIDPPAPAEPSGASESITFHVAGMNQRLQIL